jgi:hypothetical protein
LLILGAVEQTIIVVNVGGKIERITKTAWAVELSITVILKPDDRFMFLIKIYQGVYLSVMV